MSTPYNNAKEKEYKLDYPSLNMLKKSKAKKWYQNPLLVLVVVVIIIIAFFVILEVYEQYQQYQQQQTLNQQYRSAAQQSIQTCEAMGNLQSTCIQICEMAYGSQYC
ncbi:MAG: hypothetical protein QXE51_03710 [Nitrososphaeria archaeon]